MQKNRWNITVVTMAVICLLCPKMFLFSFVFATDVTLRFSRPQLYNYTEAMPFTYGTSLYYVSKKRGGRGSAKCLLLLTWGEGGLRGHAYVTIFDFFFALDKTKNSKKLFRMTKKSQKHSKFCKNFLTDLNFLASQRFCYLM